MRFGLLILATCCLVAAAESAPGLRGRVICPDGASPAGLEVVLAKHGVESRSAEGGDLAHATLAADGAFAFPAPAIKDELAVSVRDAQGVRWGKSHLKPGTDLGEITLPQTGKIECGVSGPDGKPLAGVVVVLRCKNANTCTHWSDSHRLTTDAEGGFDATGLAQGTWNLGLDDPQWAPTRQEVTVGSGLAVVQLAAKRAGMITGMVRDQAGMPVAGAKITKERHRMATTTSAADGAFTLGGMGDDEVQLRASAPGLALAGNAPITVKTKAGEKVVQDLVLLPAGSLAITVTAEDPAFALPSEVVVGLDGRGDSGYEARPLPLSDGVAKLSEVAPGSYQLEVSAPGTGTAKVPVTVVAGQEAQAQAKLPRVWPYAGTITGPGGQPVAGVEVTGMVMTGNGRFSFSSRQEAKVDAEGRFRFDGLEAGTLQLEIKAKGFVPQKHSIVIGPGTKGDDAFGLAPGSTIRVTVLDPAGKPVAGADVRIKGDDDADWSEESDEAGVATIDGLAPGELKMTVSHDEYQRLSRKLRVPEDGAAIQVQLVAGLTITGTVLAADGTPVEGANISAWRQSTGDQEYDSRSATSGKDGGFRLTGLSQGSYQIQAYKERENLATLRAVAAGGKGVRLQAKADLSLTFLVTKPDGTPAPGITLKVDNRRGDNADATTDAAGTATLKLRQGDRHVISAQPAGFTAVRQLVDLSGAKPPTSVAIRLLVGRSLRGQITVPAGVRLPALQVQAQAMQRRPGGLGQSPPQAVGADGSFTLTEVAPGQVMVTVMADESIQLAQRTVLVPTDADPPPLVVALPALGGIAGKLPTAVTGRAYVMAFNPKGDVHAWIEVRNDRSFAIDALPVGDYQVMINPENAAKDATKYTASCTITAGTVSQVEFTAGAAGQTVTGRIRWPGDGKGSGHITLLADPDRPVSMNRMMRREGQANASMAEDGSFTLTGVRPGRHLLQAMQAAPDGGSRTTWSTEIRIGAENQPLDLEAKGLLVKGSVTDPSGNPLPGALVTVVPREGGLMRRWLGAIRGRSGDDGGFTAGLMPLPAVCDAMVEHADWGKLVVTGVNVQTAMAPLAVQFHQRVALRGRVTAPAGVAITLAAYQPQQLAGDLTVVAAGDGAYAFADDQALQPGEWTIYAFADGCAVESRQLRIEADTTLDLTLVPGGRLRIAVTAPAGTEVAGLETSLRDAAGDLLRPRNPFEKQRQPLLVIGPVEADGSTEVEGLKPGTWTVSVPGAKPISVEVKAGETATATLAIP